MKNQLDTCVSIFSSYIVDNTKAASCYLDDMLAYVVYGAKFCIVFSHTCYTCVYAAIYMFILQNFADIYLQNFLHIYVYLTKFCRKQQNQKRKNRSEKR